MCPLPRDAPLLPICLSGFRGWWSPRIVRLACRCWGGSPRSLSGLWRGRPFVTCTTCFGRGPSIVLTIGGFDCCPSIALTIVGFSCWPSTVLATSRFRCWPFLILTTRGLRCWPPAVRVGARYTPSRGTGHVGRSILTLLTPRCLLIVSSVRKKVRKWNQRIQHPYLYYLWPWVPPPLPRELPRPLLPPLPRWLLYTAPPVRLYSVLQRSPSCWSNDLFWSEPEWPQALEDDITIKHKGSIVFLHAMTWS